MNMALVFNDGNFESEVMKAEQPVLVDFYADWCGPCKMMAPVVEELAAEYTGKVKVGKLNVDDNTQSAARFRVMSIPTIVILKNGEVLDTVVGVVSKEELVEKLEKAL